MKTVLTGFLATVLSIGAAQAQGVTDEYLIAFEACGTYPRVIGRDADGQLEIGRAYPVVSVEKDEIRIWVPGARNTPARVVRDSCGVRVAAVPGQPEGGALVPAPVEEATNLSLALTWQPAFCQRSRNRKRPECKALNGGLRPEAAKAWSIHGLWPQPNGTAYCGVPVADVLADLRRNWGDLPAPEVDMTTLGALGTAMPGAESDLDRHEWIKHGTCHGDAGGADGYFDDTLQLLDVINASEVGRFMAENIGKRIETDDLRAAFDAAFGPGVGERVSVKCSGRGDDALISEILVSMRGKITPTASLAALIAAAPVTNSRCDGGTVDAAGVD